MRSVFALAVKDLRILVRDRFGLFWVAAFPLLMALFFGSIFSSGGGGARSLKVAFTSTGDSTGAAAFRAELEGIDVLNVMPMPLDSARELVAQGKIVASVHYIDTSSSVWGFFGSGRPFIEVGIDPARRAESGYLKGLVTQAYFALLRRAMMNPGQISSSLSEQMSALDTASGLNDQERTAIRDLLGSVNRLMSAVDTTDTQSVGENSPFGDVPIEFEDITVSRQTPASSWEITFPQSLQWALIGVAATFAVSIVTERRRGTYLRLRLAPIGRAHILAGKGLACFLACLVSSVMLLAVGIVIFDVRVQYPPGLLVAVLSAAFCFVGIMMFISVLGKTEQSVGGAGWALLLVMSMTGGGMVPLFAMPAWMSTIGNISPVKWSVLAMEGAIWRGFGPAEMLRPVLFLLCVGLAGFVIGTFVLRRSD